MKSNFERMKNPHRSDVSATADLALHLAQKTNKNPCGTHRTAAWNSCRLTIASGSAVLSECQYEHLVLHIRSDILQHTPFQDWEIFLCTWYQLRKNDVFLGFRLLVLAYGWRSMQKGTLCTENQQRHASLSNTHSPYEAQSTLASQSLAGDAPEVIFVLENFLLSAMAIIAAGSIGAAGGARDAPDKTNRNTHTLINVSELHPFHRACGN